MKARRLARQGVCSELGVARRGLVWPESRADAKLKNRLCQANSVSCICHFKILEATFKKIRVNRK